MPFVEVSLGGHRLRSLSRVITCLSKVGSDVLLYPGPEEFAFRTFNSAKSAFLSVSFGAPFFDVYRAGTPTALRTVLLKSVGTVFRTPAAQMEKLTILLEEEDSAKMQWIVDSIIGVRKTYSISCLDDCDVLEATATKDDLPSHMVVKPRDLNRIISNFQSTLSEMTLVASDPTAASVASSGLDQPLKPVLFRSFINPTRESGEVAMHTQLWLDPTEELQAYVHSGPTTDVTFSIRELRGFVSFCESAEADIEMYFFRPASPVLFMPRFVEGDFAHAHTKATLILATVAQSALGGGADPTPRTGPEQSPGSTGRAASGSRAGINRSGHAHAGPYASSERASVPMTDRTRHWSDLSAGQRPATTDQSGEPSGRSERPDLSAQTSHGARQQQDAAGSGPFAEPSVSGRGQPQEPPPGQGEGTSVHHHTRRDDHTAQRPEQPARAGNAPPSVNPNVWSENNFTEEGANDEDDFFIQPTPEERRNPRT